MNVFQVASELQELYFNQGFYTEIFSTPDGFWEARITTKEISAYQIARRKRAVSSTQTDTRPLAKVISLCDYRKNRIINNNRKLKNS